MKNYWTECTARERGLLILAGSLFLLGGLYFLVAAPLMAWRTEAARKAVRAEAVYDLVSEAAAKGRLQAARPRPANAPPLRSYLITSARDAGIILNFVNLRSDGAVEASADNLEPSKLFSWLEHLRTQQGVVITNADIAREPGEGMAVRAQLVFTVVE